MPKKKKESQETEKRENTHMRKLAHQGYEIVQNPRNHHIMISRGGKMVYHASFNRPLTDEQLRQQIDDYLVLAERLGMPR